VKAVNYLFGVLLLIGAATAVASQKADLVLVKKSERKLLLVRGGEPFREFSIALGPRPRGHKLHAGDERTPEGRYLLDYKRERSRFYKAIHISYPNDNDIAHARRLGLNPGGNVMIHGFPNEGGEQPEVAQLFNWTGGCIAVTNAEMDEIWLAVDPGTPIEIHP
jgi:murein L,D-transpeptidase YafK